MQSRYAYVNVPTNSFSSISRCRHAKIKQQRRKGSGSTDPNPSPTFYLTTFILILTVPSSGAPSTVDITNPLVLATTFVLPDLESGSAARSFARMRMTRSPDFLSNFNMIVPFSLRTLTGPPDQLHPQ